VTRLQERQLGLIYSAAFRQAGITKATGMIDLVDATAAFHALVRYPIGPRVAIITAPGGPGIATTDACEEAGLTIPPLEAEIRKALMGVMPSFGSPVNPVDLTLQASTIPGLIPNAVKIVSTSKAIDMILLISQINDERAKEFLELAPQIEKPLVIVGSGIEGIPEASKPLLKAGIPSYPTPDRAAQALAKVVQYKAWVTQNES
ncbi:MAG: hypothetical protein HY731_10850, partial [Candidatus Tectomicrobia bacterium]|nr:hypothetical protein [Candidatus Tectomicrobia bacterium]